MVVLAYECGDVRDGEGTVQDKHAKIVSPTQERAMLGDLETTRYPHRDRVMLLLSMKTGGRTIPMHPEVQAALVALQTWRGDAAGPDRPILFSERGGGLSPATVRLWFHRLYTSLKMDG